MKLNKEGLEFLVANVMGEDPARLSPLALAIVSYLEVATVEVERFALTYGADLDTTFPVVRAKAIKAVINPTDRFIAEVEETAGAVMFAYWKKHGESFYNFLRKGLK